MLKQVYSLFRVPSFNRNLTLIRHKMTPVGFPGTSLSTMDLQMKKGYRRILTPGGDTCKPVEGIP